MTDFFICNPENVNSKLQTLTKAGTSVESYEDYYVDKNTNENWILSRYDSEFHGDVTVLKKLPEPTIEKLIEIAMNTVDTTNIIGASLELHKREEDQNENFREKLLHLLLQIDTSNLSHFEKERIKIKQS